MQVEDMSSMFEDAQAFVGTCLEKWKTGTLVSLHRSFRNAHKMNAYVGGWDVSQVTSLEDAFDNAYAFEGNGVEKWDITKVVAMAHMFHKADSLTSCSKRMIADAWAGSKCTDPDGGTLCNAHNADTAACIDQTDASGGICVFKKPYKVFTDTPYDTEWANDSCPLTDAQFKQASWGTSCDVGLHLLTRTVAYPHSQFNSACVSEDLYSFLTHTPSPYTSTPSPILILHALTRTFVP